jgi:AcrR family transcriptional regulator
VGRRRRRSRGGNPPAKRSRAVATRNNRKTDRRVSATNRLPEEDILSPVTTHPAAGADRVRRAAITLFRERGYHGTSMRTLSGRLRVEAPSLYYHFASKQDILFDILDRTLDDLLTGLGRAVAASEDPEGQLRAGVRFHVLFHTHRRTEAFLSHSELRSLTPANLRRIIAKRDQYEQVFRDVLTAGVKAGVFEVSDTKLTVIAILTMCTSVATWFSEGGRLDADAIVDCYTEMILRSVGAVRMAAGSESDARRPPSRKNVSAALR